MRFHVVPLSEEQSRQIPPISKLLLDLAEPALLLSARTRTPPIILFCDEITGEFPGAKVGQEVFLLNEAAWTACAGLNLKAIKTIDEAEIPEKYGLLIGPASAVYSDRKFD
jgi:hypothetical protein